MDKKWLYHLMPVHDISYTSFGILLTWPYHRTLRYFTLDPAAHLSRSLISSDDYLIDALLHWKQLKANELDFVRKASTVAAAGVIGIFSWNEVAETFWVARALFYLSLSLSIWAVLASAQQTSVVHALPFSSTRRTQLRQTALVILRHHKVTTCSRTGKSFAELNMLFVWQVPLMLMSYAIVTLLVALTLHVCSPLIGPSENSGRKVAIFYLGTGLVLLLIFAWSSAWVYWTPDAALCHEDQGLSTANTMVTVRTDISGDVDLEKGTTKPS